VARTRSVVTLVSLLLLLGIAAVPIQAVARSHSKDSHSKHSQSKDSHGKGSKGSKGGKGSKGSHSKHATHRTKTLLLRKSVRRSGMYSIHVTIAWPAAPRGEVKLKIGSHTRKITAHGRRRTTVVHATISVKGRVLTIRETPLRGHPKLRLRVERIGNLRASSKVATKPPAPATTPSTAGSSGSSSGPLQPTGVPGTWNLIFDDEFSGTSLNAANWSTGWFGAGITKSVTAGEPECYDPSHVVEANGELDLSLTQESESCGATQPYTSGIVTTNGKFSFTYGFVEVRAWLPTLANGQAADWPAIWLDGQSWPNDGEIDLMEGLGGSVCAHWHGPTNGGAGYGAGGGTGCPAGTYTGGWHTFAADWEPGIVTYYYDGKSIGSVSSSTSTITGSPMYIILNLAGEPGGGTTAPATLRIKYVRVWQH
jgi:beta-glucanase (GH16 family)